MSTTVYPFINLPEFHPDKHQTQCRSLDYVMLVQEVYTWQNNTRILQNSSVILLKCMRGSHTNIPLCMIRGHGVNYFVKLQFCVAPSNYIVFGYKKLSTQILTSWNAILVVIF